MADPILFPSFIIVNEFPITRQAGDSGYIKMTVPETIPLDGKKAYFQVSDNKDNIIFTKDDPGGVWTSGGTWISGQDIYIILTGEETKETKQGVYYWEIEVYSNELLQNTTVGKGPFILQKNKTIRQ